MRRKPTIDLAIHRRLLASLLRTLRAVVWPPLIV